MGERGSSPCWSEITPLCERQQVVLEYRFCLPLAAPVTTATDPLRFISASSGFVHDMLTQLRGHWPFELHVLLDKRLLEVGRGYVR